MNLREEIAQILRWETSVLDPEDANGLARTLEVLLPPVFRVAPELLAALETAAQATLRLQNGTGFPCAAAIVEARAAIAKAKGEQS